MRIKELTLVAADLSAQAAFYLNDLSFEGSFENNLLEIQAGTTTLRFVERAESPYYHFAFLIPKGKLDEAITFCEGRSIPLMQYEGKQVIDFGTGTSIYFFDPAGNIVEFIDRPSLHFLSDHTFSATDTVCINEIGLPVKDPLQKVEELLDTFGIIPMDRSRFDNDFCWGGNFEGTFLVVKQGRKWLPTELPAISNDFDIEFETSTGMHKTSFIGQ
ncbi:MAG: hypothetical protein P8O05_07550 [Flavobacteriales bacterium]|nr:hypothetical protein [Flavobacteriales bacterium]MDG2246671.1 hypothetical protein [Flavobacteriales bacterium]